MAMQAEQSASLTGFEDKPIYTNKKLIFAVAAQFCYVGAQVAVASQFISYGQKVAGLTAANASNRYAVGQGVFAIGRFASAGLLLYVKPRYIIFGSAVGVLVFTILAMILKGEAGLAMLTIVLFFESNQFPVSLPTNHFPAMLCDAPSAQLYRASTDIHSSSF
jgi:FHS family L-fucose permease-like MFS transporter